MRAVTTAISLLGGLAMFLYGMEVMGDGLKQGSGAALKNVLEKLTHNVFFGVLTGTLVTAVIQSSTATIVLAVGLIGAGILNLKQAASIVMGANIGTTVTAQIIRLMDLEASENSLLAFLKPDMLAPMALIIGIILLLFINKPVTRNVGSVAIGFGILFTGLMSMTAAVKPLAESDFFMEVLAYFAQTPVVGILAGLVLTVIVQSSSAMVGILQALSSTGALTFDLIYPIIMGINLGTCVVTALICSIGSSKDAKRISVVHIVFNCVGTIVFMIVMTMVHSFGGFPELWTKVVDSGDIANFQTVFNIATAVVLLPFADLLVKLACKVVKDDPEDEDLYPEMASLDKNLMISPTIALAQVSCGVASMAKAAKDNVGLSLKQFKSYETKRAEKIQRYEERIDQFTDTADNYMIEMAPHIETESDNIQLNMLMQCVRDVERIGDYATNFEEMACKMAHSEHSFSIGAMKELELLGDAVLEILRLTVDALETESDTTARRIEPLEEVIDDMVLELKNRHTDRLCRSVCTIDSGLVFMDALTYFERTADQCSNIAMQLLGRHNEDIKKNHHVYLAELHASGDQSYLAEHKNRREQYLVPLENIKY